MMIARSASSTATDRIVIGTGFSFGAYSYSSSALFIIKYASRYFKDTFKGAYVIFKIENRRVNELYIMILESIYSFVAQLVAIYKTRIDDTNDKIIRVKYIM